MSRTVEEYHTAAILLDMMYDRHTHTFWRIKDDVLTELDADTLEKLDDNEVGKRHQRYLSTVGVASVTLEGNLPKRYEHDEEH